MSTDAYAGAPDGWPPTVRAVGADLSVGGLFGIAVGVDLLASAAALALADWEGPLSYLSWLQDPDPEAATRQLLVPSILAAAAWVAIVGALGWRRAVGLRRGVASSWGLIPLGALWIAILVAAGSSEVADRTTDYLAIIVVGLFAAAFLEELVYRGVLLHGLGRRYGGTRAVLASSAMFGLAHVPAFLLEPAGPLVLVILVIEVFLFGVGMCRIRAATGSILLPTAIHAMTNLVTAQIVWVPPLGEVQPVVLVAKFLPFVVGLVALVELGVVVLRRRIRIRRRAVVTRVPTTGANASLGSPNGSPRIAVAHAAASQRFTLATRRAMVRAQEEARRRGDGEISTADLLTGAVYEGDEVVVRALASLGVGLPPAPTLEAMLGASDDPSDALPYAPEARAALARVADEATALGHLFIGTGHLLLGLLDDAHDPTVAACLAALGLDAHRAEQAVLDELAEEFGTPMPLRQRPPGTSNR